MIRSLMAKGALKRVPHRWQKLKNGEPARAYVITEAGEKAMQENAAK